jgi:nitroreductase
MNRQSSSALFCGSVAAAALATVAAFMYTQRKFQSDSKNLTPQQALQLIQNRRSIFAKQYNGEPVSRNVLVDMLEAARWAPSHHLTQAWHFVVFETIEQRGKLGNFLAERYRDKMTEDLFNEKKYSKKIANATKSSFVIAICVKTSAGGKYWEEVCSVACAVQNMLLVASAHRVGAYWSSSASEDQSTLNFLQLSPDDYVCLGWVFVGNYDGKWPRSQRKQTSFTLYGAS